MPRLSSKANGRDAGAKPGPAERSDSDAQQFVAHPPQKRKAFLVLSIVLMVIWLAFLTWMAFWT